MRQRWAGTKWDWVATMEDMMCKIRTRLGKGRYPIFGWLSGGYQAKRTAVPVKSPTVVGVWSRNEPLQATTEAMKTKFDGQHVDELAIIWEVWAAEWQLDRGIGSTKALVWYEDQTVQFLSDIFCWWSLSCGGKCAVCKCKKGPKWISTFFIFCMWRLYKKYYVL